MRLKNHRNRSFSQERAIDQTDWCEEHRKNKRQERVKLVVWSFDDMILKPGTAFGQ